MSSGREGWEAVELTLTAGAALVVATTFATSDVTAATEAEAVAVVLVFLVLLLDEEEATGVDESVTAAEREMEPVSGLRWVV